MKLLCLAWCAWMALLMVCLILYTERSEVPHDCTWLVFFSLPFIAVGNVRNALARKSMLKLLNRVDNLRRCWYWSPW